MVPVSPSRSREPYDVVIPGKDSFPALRLVFTTDALGA